MNCERPPDILVTSRPNIPTVLIYLILQKLPMHNSTIFIWNTSISFCDVLILLDTSISLCEDITEKCEFEFHRWGKCFEHTLFLFLNPDAKPSPKNCQISFYCGAPEMTSFFSRVVLTSCGQSYMSHVDYYSWSCQPKRWRMRHNQVHRSRIYAVRNQAFVSGLFHVGFCNPEGFPLLKLILNGTVGGWHAAAHLC